VKVILVRPAYDVMSQKMSAWAEKVKSQVACEDDLEGPTATEGNLRSSLQGHPDAPLVAFYGHGLSDSLLTMDTSGTEVALVHTTNPGVLPQEFSGRNLYAVACNSAVELGPALFDAGCPFVGYEKEFLLPAGFENAFGDIVNSSLISWAASKKTSTDIAQQLATDWRKLSDDLSSGAGNRNNLWVGAMAALWNGDKVRAY
jgi:hypothetical protein